MWFKGVQTRGRERESESERAYTVVVGEATGGLHAPTRWGGA